MTTRRILHGADVTVWAGDSRQVLADLGGERFDAVVTDPPYGLSAPPDIKDVLAHWDAGDDYKGRTSGFMSAAWDSFVPGPALWRQVLNVCKPGAPAVVFAGSRTVDLMMASLRRAGWVIDGTRHLEYASGMPKALDIAKALDRAGGVPCREQAGALRAAREAAGLSRDELAARVGCSPASIRDWEEGRARSNGAEPEWLVPSPAYRKILNEVLGYTQDARRPGEGTGRDRTADGNVYSLGHTGQLFADRPGTELAARWAGWKTQLKGAHEPVILAHAPGADPGVDVRDVYTAKAGSDERVRAYVPSCGCFGDVHGPDGDPDVVQFAASACAHCGVPYAEYGHPTVKPVAAMRELVRVCPPDGLVLDPFAGTGTTGVAAVQAGRRAVLIDADPVHAAMARSRFMDTVQTSLLDLLPPSDVYTLH